MHRRDLLPGVTESGPPPVVVQHSRKTLEQARRRAGFIDTAQLLLIAAVDLLFLRWPSAHLPTLDRDETTVALLLVNVLMLASIWVSRAVPRWTAQRIARTWCPREQSRFFGK